MLLRLLSSMPSSIADRSSYVWWILSSLIIGALIGVLVKLRTYDHSQSGPLHKPLKDVLSGSLVGAFSAPVISTLMVNMVAALWFISIILILKIV